MDKAQRRRLYCLWKVQWAWLRSVQTGPEVAMVMIDRWSEGALFPQRVTKEFLGDCLQKLPHVNMAQSHMTRILPFCIRALFDKLSSTPFHHDILGKFLKMV